MNDKPKWITKKEKDSKWITKKKNEWITKKEKDPDTENFESWITKKKKNIKEEYIAKTKGGIEKRYKGGLMVKPKTAKRGY